MDGNINHNGNNMITFNKEVHIGREIRRVLQEKNITVTEFARRICCHRKNVYDIFSRKSLDIDKIIMISEILSYDFIHELYTEAVEVKEFHLRYANGKLTVLTDSEEEE